MNIELTEIEKKFLQEFAAKQCEGAKDNIGTMTPIHVVERVRKTFIEGGDKSAWVCEDLDWAAFDSFEEMLTALREAHDDDLTMFPDYGSILYEDVGYTWVCDEDAYCDAFDIKAYPGQMVEYTEPIAFFFIRDEAVKYKDEYQAHNCTDCRIYTYGLGYSNKGDLPVFRALLMRLGEMITAQEGEQGGHDNGT